jgi:hypothetical protein
MTSSSIINNEDVTKATEDVTALSITDTNNQVNALGYPYLQPMTPVPSDIVISQHIVQTVGLLPISDIAKQLRFVLVYIYILVM